MTDYAAGDLHAGISAWLGMKIIRMGVDYHRPADHIIHTESSRQHRHIGPAAAGKKGRQIAGVVWMLLPFWIEVVFCVTESIAAAVGSFVDVKAVDPVFLGQTMDVRHNQNAPLGLIKFHSTGHMGGFLSPADTGEGF